MKTENQTAVLPADVYSVGYVDIFSTTLCFKNINMNNKGISLKVFIESRQHVLVATQR
jgi:hypothetical protein